MDPYPFLPDLPRGPLDEYRKLVPNLNWKCLKVALEGVDAVKIKYRTYAILEAHPLFDRGRHTPTTEEQKRIAAEQMMMIKDLDIFPPEIFSMEYRPRYRYLMAVNECLHAYSPSLAVKIALGVGLFQNALLAMGTKQHMDYYTKAWTREIVTCLAITEVAHGSNTKQIGTTATFDPATQEFVIHTPNFEAAKCLIGNLGKTATVALLFALLITPNGENHGLHGFLVPIRDSVTLKPYPGILVGDVGEKIGLHGIDNGFIMFNQYRVPKVNLLNRTSDVTPSGEFVSVFSDPTKTLGAALEGLMTGRVGISIEAAGSLSYAAVIATRYAAIRKQFGFEKDGPELPLIDYQLHQYRIFPYLAAACVLKVAVVDLSETYYIIIENSSKESVEFEQLSKQVAEIHALVSAFKPLCTWTARDAIQEAREACGGHGFLKAANLGELRSNNDPCLTYEGDNNVLGQQTSNWLLKQWTGELCSPLGTCKFIAQRQRIMQHSYSSLVQQHGLDSFQFYERCYEWLMCFLLNAISQELAVANGEGRNRVDTKNRTQVYRANTLVKIYGEYHALCAFHRRYVDQRDPMVDELGACMRIIYLIYAQFALDKHLLYFYEGDFANGPTMVTTIRHELLHNCGELRKYAVTVADALAPPDFFLASVIAKADGNLYQNLQRDFMTGPGALERPTWWRNVLPVRKLSKL